MVRENYTKTPFYILVLNLIFALCVRTCSIKGNININIDLS